MSLFLQASYIGSALVVVDGGSMVTLVVESDGKDRSMVTRVSEIMDIGANCHFQFIFAIISANI